MTNSHDSSPSEQASDLGISETDLSLEQEVQRLHELTVWSRWLVVLTLWLVFGSLSLWSLRSDIQLWLDYFTWAAVRYAFAFNRLAAIGIGVCVGMTVSVLLWQSRNILWGLPAKEQHHLRQRVLQIRQQGKSHPLWTWIHSAPPR